MVSGADNPSRVDIGPAAAVLRSTFGFNEFRPGQAEVIEAILAGRDILAVMPTGSGKSLCYQIPALLRDGLTVVVSPLISLMQNQVAQLQDCGVPAGTLNSATTWADQREILEKASAGALRLIYMAPERFSRPATLEFLKRAGVSLLAVDEAHCVSQWGHDFRPEYLAIGDMAAQLGSLQVVAFTATADAGTRSEIARQLFAPKPQIFVHGFDRPNLHLAVRPKASARKQVLAFADGHRNESGIIYCSSRRQTEELADFLAQSDFRALPYHAGLDGAVRERNQRIFLQEDGCVMVATVAFGMGIDKPDVRFVAHAGLPKNIESYYQEIGRAGRDGLPAATLMLYGMSDIRLRRLQIDESDLPDEQKRADRQRLNALVALCEAPRCRRQTLLSYFGEEAEACGNCDLCMEGAELIDGTILAQKALSAIVRTGERFGTEHLISLLRGEETEAVTKFGHEKLPTFGVGEDLSRNDWRSVFRQLYATGVLSLEIGGYGGWTLSERASAILRGKDKIELRRDKVEVSGRRNALKARKPDSPELSESDEALFHRLRELRRMLAGEMQVPAYVIFPDRTLLDMALLKPTNRKEMLGVHGVGQAKFERHGAAFLELIQRNL